MFLILQKLHSSKIWENKQLQNINLSGYIKVSWWIEWLVGIDSIKIIDLISLILFPP